MNNCNFLVGMNNMSLIPPPSSSSSSSCSRYNEDGTYPGGPVGFRFSPRYKDLVKHFLIKKVTGLPMADNPIKELDIFNFNPQDLPILITDGNERWMYFFVYMTPENAERSTPDGYWKLAKSDRTVEDPDAEEIIALKNSFVYYTRELGPNRRYKTKWTMEEFRVYDADTLELEDPEMKNWVVCKIETVSPEEPVLKGKKKKRKRRAHKY